LVPGSTTNKKAFEFTKVVKDDIITYLKKRYDPVMATKISVALKLDMTPINYV
jgi:hypothetical protein